MAIMPSVQDEQEDRVALREGIRMRARKRQRALLGALVAVGAALLAPSAQASVTPSLNLDQSAGTQAGATHNLGLNLSFQDSPTDSPDNLVISLPPGLLANAAINGGGCLTTTDLSDAKCQVGTGTVNADALVDLNLVALPVDVTFDLVPPPAAGDLAGLAVNFDGTQIGATAGIRVRPSGDPAGVGLTLDFVLPNNLAGVPIEITGINSTFDGLRYPATCPSTPAKVSVSVDSYQDLSVHSLSAPLEVTGCSSLTYAPKVAVSVAKDSSDREVSVKASVTQGPTESPTHSLALGFPGNTLGVNLSAVRLLCGNVVTDKCTPVGLATAVSPLYPKPLTANAYLTGTALGPTLTLVFPPPFPLTLVGNVSLTGRSATFADLPDIPLTTLGLTFNGGPEGMFLTNCAPGHGAASGTATDQNGDKTASASVPYQVSGCPGPAAKTRSSRRAPAVSTPTESGAKTGHPTLRFRVTAAGQGAKLAALRIKLPHGISFVSHREGKHGAGLTVRGVKLSGAVAKSVSLSAGVLVIELVKPAGSVGFTLTGSALSESSAAVVSARSGKARGLRLTLTTLDTQHHRQTVTKAIKVT